jgi:probable HAF family extracellular repeat protein
MLRPSSFARRSPTRPGFTPRLEALEDRLAPAVYSLTDLGTPSGYSSFHADALNASGQVVGFATSGPGSLTPFLYNNGQFSDLGSPSGYNHLTPVAINNSGQILADGATGNAVFPTFHALLYSNGQWADLGAPSGAKTLYATGLDDAGEVLASATTGSGSSAVSHPFLYSHGQWIDPGAPSGVTLVTGFGAYINGAGEVVATGGTSSGVSHPFLYSNGQWTDPGAPSGANFAFGVRINGSGQIVADGSTGSDPSANIHAFLYTKGQWADLGAPSGTTNLDPSGLDDAGEVLAIATTVSGSSAVEQAVLYSGGQWTELNSLLPQGSTVTPAGPGAINANGEIILQGSNGHSYLLTPKSINPPTPVGDLSLFAFGFGPGMQLDLFEVDQKGQVFALAFNFANFENPSAANAQFVDTDMAFQSMTVTEAGGYPALMGSLMTSDNHPLLMATVPVELMPGAALTDVLKAWQTSGG